MTGDLYPETGYTFILMYRAERRATVIAIRRTMAFDDAGRLLSGRGTAGCQHDVTHIKVLTTFRLINRHGWTDITLSNLHTSRVTVQTTVY